MLYKSVKVYKMGPKGKWKWKKNWQIEEILLLSSGGSCYKQVIEIT